MLEACWLWFVISKEYVELTRPKIESRHRHTIALASFREWSVVSAWLRIPNPEIPASPVIQLRPRPVYCFDMSMTEQCVCETQPAKHDWQLSTHWQLSHTSYILYKIYVWQFWFLPDARHISRTLHEAINISYSLNLGNVRRTCEESEGGGGGGGGVIPNVTRIYTKNRSSLNISKRPPSAHG